MPYATQVSDYAITYNNFKKAWEVWYNPDAIEGDGVFIGEAPSYKKALDVMTARVRDMGAVI